MTTNESLKNIPIEDIMDKNNLFWQYPVITEKTFYEQNKKDPLYICIPWATIIDAPDKYNIENIILTIYKYVTPSVKYYTCCQHIYFTKILNLCKFLGITTLYSPHKVKDVDKINGITILPCPLYAVNYEDPRRNSIFKNKNFLDINRNLLYSFIGGYQSVHYLTDIRLKIFKIPGRSDICIINSGSWHFNDIVYNKSQNIYLKENKPKNHDLKTETYNNILLSSRFSLAPSGSGPNSIRFWESLAVGAIPVLLSDTLELPHHPDWNDAIVFLKESELSKLDDELSKISPEKEESMRKKCIEIYNYFSNNYCNKNIKEIEIN